MCVAFYNIHQSPHSAEPQSVFTIICLHFLANLPSICETREPPSLLVKVPQLRQFPTLRRPSLRGRDWWSRLALKRSREDFWPNCLLIYLTVQVLVCFPPPRPWHPCSPPSHPPTALFRISRAPVCSRQLWVGGSWLSVEHSRGEVTPLIPWV